MKHLAFAIGLSALVFSPALAQYNTGDSQLNVILAKFDDEARADFGFWKRDMSSRSGVPESKITKWSVEFGFKGGDIYLVIEISRITRRPIDEVANIYRTNRTKGWGAIAKELGIKPGSPEFHALKKGASGHAAQAQDKGKGNGKGNGKGK
ncbi:MAG: hypothetical protein LOY03_01805 [Cyclobacteriaceae bacterium]|jgi:hypothetical protein|nr:hypothetical protein [Cyclobacteriaceae bacterium]